jgi:hypothetical protein
MSDIAEISVRGKGRTCYAVYRKSQTSRRDLVGGSGLRRHVLRHTLKGPTAIDYSSPFSNDELHCGQVKLTFGIGYRFYSILFNKEPG